MRSFSDYVSYRSSLSIDEMAAPRQKYINSKGEEVFVDEVRRTPIFMDQDDIDYLYQFPPKFWKQALMARYGKLLQEAYEAQQKGERVKDKQNVQIDKSGSGKQTFEVDTGINKLLDKLTHDVDDDKYRKLGLKNKDAYLQHAKDAKEKEGRNLGSYGFVLSDFSSGGGLRAAKGFVSPDESTIRGALREWYDGISAGWFDDEIEKHEMAEVEIGAGGRKDKTTKMLKVSPEIFTWTSKEGQVFKSYRPILRPAIMVKASDKTSVEIARKAQKQIESDLRSSDGMNQYFEILDLNSPNLINMKKLSQIVTRMTQINKILDESKKDTKENANLKKELASLEKLGICAEFIGGINLGIREKNVSRLSTAVNPTIQNMKLTPLGYKLKNLIMEASKSDNPQQKINSIIRSFVKRLYDRFEERAKSTIRTAERYDVHDWNAMHFSGKSPYGKWSRIGTINPNYQSKEKTHGGLQSILGIENVNSFWRHLLNDLDLKSYVKDGVNRSIDSVKGGSQPEIRDAIRIALQNNIKMIYDQASDYFMYRGGTGSVLEYARLYKNTLDNTEPSSEESTNKPKILKAMQKDAFENGQNFTGSLAQLHVRFKNPQRWNRLLRFANPSSTHTMEEIFRNFYELGTDLHPETSHEISTLFDIMSRNPDSELEIETKIDGETEENNQLSKNILAVATRHILGALGRMGKALGLGKKPAAPQDQTPQGQTPKGQTPQGQTPQDQTPQGQTPQGQTPQGQTPKGQTPQGQTPQSKKPSFSGFLNLMKGKKN